MVRHQPLFPQNNNSPGHHRCMYFLLPVSTNVLLFKRKLKAYILPIVSCFLSFLPQHLCVCTAQTHTETHHLKSIL
uniref:Uncharacterized protein n=1 Tax=Lotus japonicus TaxID=34305 RepID=I3T2R9_LOTJA|nr:unknown [Lotus japonicus]